MVSLSSFLVFLSSFLVLRSSFLVFLLRSSFLVFLSLFLVFLSSFLVCLSSFLVFLCFSSFFVFLVVLWSRVQYYVRRLHSHLSRPISLHREGQVDSGHTYLRSSSQLLQGRTSSGIRTRGGEKCERFNQRKTKITKCARTKRQNRFGTFPHFFTIF